MQGTRPAAWTAALLLTITACSSRSEPGDVATDGAGEVTVTTDSTDSESTATPERDAADDETTSTTARPVASSELELTVPDEIPEEASFEVIEIGEGEIVEAGDTVLTAWEMVAIGSGELVESTAESGGPIPVTIGAGNVPAALDDAMTGQPIGTRLDVQFPIGMADLPQYLDADEAYVLAVQLVELAPEPEIASPQPTTTTPGAPRPGSTDLYVPATGPLSATPPTGSDLPGRNSSTIVNAGDGPTLNEGDDVELDYVVVSWTTGEVVLSTAADFNGTQTVVLGDVEVPRILESAIFEQSVGSRVQVIYAPDLPDLPEGLSPDDAYIVAVDIVSVG